MMAVLRIEERRARLFGIDRREAPVKASLSNKEMRDLSEKMEGIAVHGKKLPTGVLFHFSKAVDTEIGGMAWWAGYHQAMSGDAGFDTAGLTGAQIEAKA
ncbi:MAG: hypothetical protein LBJ46_01480, partial [Planctomycetota bacterium]|nr:hypothetical protein [Planctomycetota bacterium]